MNRMDTLRHWLMGVIAGDKFAYWISDDVENSIADLGRLSGGLGGGAAICFAKVMEEGNWDTGTFTLDTYTITVQRNEVAA